VEHNSTDSDARGQDACTQGTAMPTMIDAMTPITSIGKLPDAVVEARNTLGVERLWFRGQPNPKQQLCAWIDRIENGRKIEANLFDRFRDHAPLRGPDCPNHDDRPAWLPLMRHHGLYTRLLDWSSSMLVACFFAVDKQECHESDGEIWALAPGKLNARFGYPKLIIPIDGDVVRPQFDAMFMVQVGENEPEEAQKVLAVHARQVSPRMVVQQGEFTIHGIRSPLEDIISAEGDPFLLRFTVPANEKPLVRKELYDMGIHKSQLFPDLDYLAEALNREALGSSQIAG
jgi:hypothetical protein